jgi:hypothetical protein
MILLSTRAGTVAVGVKGIVTLRSLECIGGIMAVKSHIDCQKDGALSQYMMMESDN